MGENDESLPNGLLPGSGLVVRSLDEDRWGKAEERIAELIACIQPNQLSEERRNSVADYVQRLIMKCFPCQVCTFGSVPLKTYLPDGDIDLTAFSHNQISNDTWANQVRDMLESEEKNDNSEFHVKEVQYIQAEVKIIKCLVENIVVDISFNQVGGLCTLCFLDEIDSLINQNHLFKRSIILIKAWCYYESRILGAHHGLISTYALETLVLYIFHVFNNSFHGPLEVLYRFLEFFSNFDWDNFCVSLWGPVPLSSLPDVTAAPPRKDSGELLLNKVFLDACSSVYAVIPGGQENNGQPFVSKHFNVIDPLRVNNNLGRSVSKGNFFRIRSAFAFGAKKLARLLDCPKENLIFEVNQFFMNTWDRHGSGDRPDAPEIDSWHLRSSTPDSSHEIRSSNNYNYNDNTNTNTNNNNNNNNNNYSNSKKAKEDSRVHAKKSSRATSGLKSQVRVSDKIERGNNTIPEQVILSDRSQKDSVNDTQGRLLFARTHSSPELTDDYIDVSSHVQRNRGMENADSRKKIFGPDGLSSHDTRSSVEDAIGRPHPNNSQKSPDTYTDSSSVILNSYHRDSGLDGLSDQFSASSGAQPMMNQEEQDIVNMMASTSLQLFNGQHHAPFNLTSGHLPYSIPPSFLASMGYTQRNFPGFIPANIPFMDPSFPHVQFPQGLVSPQMTTHYFPSIGLNNNPSEDSVEMNTVEVDSDFWKEQDVGPCGENEDLDTFQSVENKSSASSNSSLKYIPQSSRDIGSSNAGKTEPKHIWGKREAIRENMENPANSEVYAEEKPVSTRFSSASHSNSLQSQTSSESSWDGSSVKVASKSSKDKRGKKKNSTDVTAGHGKGKVMTGHICNDTNVVDHEWGPSVGSGTVDDFQVHNRQNNSEVAQTSGSDLMTPFAPMFVNPRSRQRTKDNSGLIAFYPTGPPIPFLTMLPVYNIPPEAGTSDASNGHFGGDETLDNSESGMSCNPKGHDTSVDSTCFERGTTASEKSEEHKSDILSSDFASHWHNLQFGRFCQNSRNQGPSFYPSPMMVPPVYVQGQLPYDNTSRPLSTDTNLIPQLVTSYGHRMVPVAPVQPGSSRNSNVYQSYIDDMPRFRGGTGTYLPNPVFTGWQLFKDHPENKAPVRDRHSFSSRRGNYNHDRNDTFGHREGNWNANPKLRSASRNHNRSQSENKINSRNDRFTHGEGRADRSWNSYRHNSTIPSYQAQNRQLLSGSSQNEPQNVSYGIYPWGAMNPNGVSNGSSGPPVVMVYPFDHNGGTYGSQIEKLEFGSLDPIGFPGVNDQSQQNDGAVARSVEDHILHGSSGYQSSPEQPSSPCHQRRV